MNGLYLWITELCVCSLMIAAAENLLPEGGVRKTVYFVMGLVVVNCFLSPMSSLDLSGIDIKPEADISAESTDWLNRTTDEMFKSSVEELIRDCLKRIDVVPKEIEIHTDINEDNCIFIDKVRVTVSPDYSEKIDETVDELYKSLGLDADVIVR